MNAMVARWRRSLTRGFASILIGGLLLVALAPPLASSLVANLANAELAKLGRYHPRTVDGQKGLPEATGDQFSPIASPSAARVESWLLLSLNWWPQNPIAAGRLGELMLAAGDRNRALAFLERAAELGADPLALAKLGDLYEMEDRMEAAVAAWSRAGGKQFCIARAETSLRSGDTARATRIMEAARALHKGDLEMDRRLVGLVASLGDRDRAAVILRERIASHPDEVEGYLLLGELLAQAVPAEVSQAATVLKEAAARFADDWRPPEILGDLYLRRGDAAGAEAQYLLALERGPFRQEAYLKLAELRRQSGQGQEAVRTLEAAYQRAGRSFALAWALVRGYEEVGDISGAERLVLEASSLAGDSGDAYGTVAEWYRGKGRHEEAAAEYLRAARYSAHRQFVWLGPWKAAESYQAAGDWTRAAETFREAVAALGDVGAPAHFQSLILMGAAEAELEVGRGEAALQLLRRAVRADPSNRNAGEKLALMESQW